MRWAAQYGLAPGCVHRHPWFDDGHGSCLPVLYGRKLCAAWFFFRCLSSASSLFISVQKPYGTASSLILGVFDRHLHSLSVCIKNSVLLTFIVAALAIHSSARHCVASPIYNQFTGAFGLAVLTPVCRLLSRTYTFNTSKLFIRSIASKSPTAASLP